MFLFSKQCISKQWYQVIKLSNISSSVSCSLFWYFVFVAKNDITRYCFVYCIIIVLNRSIVHLNFVYNVCNTSI